MPYDVIVIGGGVNGLACAALLGKAGCRTLLVEQRATLGGCAADREIAPGFRVPTLAHRTGPLGRDVVEDLQLAQHGLRFVPRSVRVTALGSPGPALTIYSDPARTAVGLQELSAHDADAWLRFERTLSRLGDVIGSLFARTPPDIDAPGARDMLALMRTLGAWRGLPHGDQWRLLRWGPMAVADLVSECFETELLRATVAADGLLGTMMGPWSAGSGLHLLWHAANEAQASSRHSEVVGGPAAVVRALTSAARRYGVEILTATGVRRIEIASERAIGVTLTSGNMVEARAVVSGVDPRQTFLSLCDADHLPPEFLWRVRNIRMRGALAKVNLALSRAPEVHGVARAALASPVRIGPDLDYLERAYDAAKYGRVSRHPWIELTVPSVADETLAPTGAHVLSAYVQFAPHTLRDSDWHRERDALADRVVEILEAHAPGLRASVVAREVVTPMDMEHDWGLTGGHIFHGELALDQAFAMRPLLGWARYRTPVRGLYLCGSGTHPGTGLTGASGVNAAREIVRDFR